MSKNLEETAQERCCFQWGVSIVGKRSKFGKVMKIKMCFGTTNRSQASGLRKFFNEKWWKYETYTYTHFRKLIYMQIFWNILQGKKLFYLIKLLYEEMQITEFF